MERDRLEHLLAELTTAELRVLDTLLHKRLTELETPSPVPGLSTPLPAPSLAASLPVKPPALAKYPTPIGDALVGAAYRVIAADKRHKRHLTKGNGRTLCNRDIERGVKAERTYEATDCRTCLQIARKKRLTCKTCGQPLLRVADKRICVACIKAKAAAKKTPRARPTAQEAPTVPDRSLAYRADRVVIPVPGQSPLNALDQVLARDRTGWALDDMLFHDPSPVAHDVTVGREWVGLRIRYTFCVPGLGLLGHILFPVVGGSQPLVEAQIAGHPDDTMTAHRQVLFAPIVTALENRTQHYGRRPLDTSPDAMLRVMASGVIITEPAYRDPSQIAYTLAPCDACSAPAAQHIFAEHGTIEDNARVMFEPIRSANVPTWIIDVSQRESAEDDRLVDVLQVWPARGARTHMRFAATKALLDVYCGSHCQR